MEDEETMRRTTDMQPLTPRYSWSRWVRFPYFVCLSMTMALVWYVYLTVPLSIIAAFQISEPMLMWISNYSYFEVIQTPFYAYFLHRFGLRKSIMFTMTLSAFSFLIRSFHMETVQYIAVSNVAALLLSFGSVIYYGTVQQICALMYYAPGYEQAAVSSVLITASVFGAAVASLVFPQLINEPVLSNGTLLNGAVIQNQFFALSRGLTVVCVVLAVLAYVLLDNRMIHSTLLSPKELLVAVRRLCPNKNFWLLTTTYGWQATVFFTLFPATVALVGAERFGMTQQRSGVACAVATFVTVLASFLVSQVCRKFHQHCKSVVIVSSIAGQIGGAWFIWILENEPGASYASFRE
jgi:MFS family permease